MANSRAETQRHPETGTWRVCAFRLSVAFCLWLTCAPIFAQTSTSAPDLQQRFQDKVLLIKGWYQNGKLTYDSSGNVVGHPTPGFWTASGVRIDSVKLHGDKFVLKGSRLGFAYDASTRKFTPVFPKDFGDVTITVEANPHTLTPAEVDKLKDSIFLEDAKVEDVPEYWRRFLDHGEKPAARKVPANLGKPGEIVEGQSSDGQPVYRVGADHHITPPKITSHFEPQFTEIARHARYQGTTLVEAVIDWRGVPTQIQIIKPIGMGLDDQAVAVVQQWRFQPATRDGNPVAVQVQIEVNFRLY